MLFLGATGFQTSGHPFIVRGCLTTRKYLITDASCFRKHTRIFVEEFEQFLSGDLTFVATDFILRCDIFHSGVCVFSLLKFQSCQNKLAGEAYSTCIQGISLRHFISKNILLSPYKLRATHNPKDQQTLLKLSLHHVRR